MEPPLIPGPPISTTISTTTSPIAPQPPSQLNNYADSLDSSPKSRTTNNSWDDQQQQQQQQSSTNTKLRLMCSYGGHIIPRPHDKSLCYVGGDTRIFVTDRLTTLYDLSTRLSKTLLSGRPFWLKYQLPNEDLDSLISVTTDEDLENMIEEYDRVNKSSRIRLFLFTNEFSGSVLESSSKSDEWFVHALNNGVNSSSTVSNKVFSESSSVNCLLGLDDDVGVGVGNPNKGSFGGGKNNVKLLSGQDVQSVPDSPMVETTSSFGSTNSTPSLANHLPPIKVHVEEEKNERIEEQFAQLGVGSKVEQSSPLAPPAAAAAAAAAPPMVAGSVLPVVVGGDYVSRAFSDDERSEQGYRNSGQTQPQQQLQQQPSQLQPKSVVVPSDLPSPSSISSESSFTNPLSGQRHFLYQEGGGQCQSGNTRVSPNSVDMKINDPNNRAPVQQQVQDAAGYATLPVQYDQHPQMYQPQQYVHAGQYIHHTPSGPVPMTSYYPIYPSQQQTHPRHPALEHQYPVYFVHSRPSQAYKMPVQRTSYSEYATTIPSNQPQTPPASSMAAPAAAYNHARSPPASRPEMTAGAYRTAAAAAPQLVQNTSRQHQQQYVGYSQIHHPSQSIAPPSASSGNYAYEFSDPSHAQIYYTQSLAPQFAAQYQTMTSSATVGLPNTSSQLPTEKKSRNKLELHQP